MRSFMSAASRREFLRRAGALSVAGAGAPLALNLAAVAAASSAAAQSAPPDDYRALVCVFLYGGNDNHNTVIPFDLATHQQYAAARASLAVPRSALAATALSPDNPWTDGRQMALHPSLAPLKTLFDEGHLSVAMNLGTLTREGTSLADYKAGLGLPPKLFSHNDQQSVWQSSVAEGATTGWGGRMADLFAASNSSAGAFTSISASGNAVFMSGQSVVQYQVSSSGSVAVDPVFGSTNSTDTLKRMMARPSTHLLEDEHAVIARRSFAADAQVRSALQGVAEPSFPTTSLGAQLKVVARLIAARQALGLKRQVFFVSLGGFDLHNDLVERHPALLAAVAEAMSAFYAATVAMGVQRQVTTFTGSDFGRTLASNGDGSDHGWGAHHFVMSGALKPRQWVGALPRMSVVEGVDNVGGGRLLPAIGVDQHGATLARWMGVSDADMPTVLPNIGNYSLRDLGYFA
jgi:uncharacterized protein (DUF1501 family)